jgi:hypothetical protein
MISRHARVLAFYLPQFHAIPENDTWWGEGFTDWVNVTRAQPLFDGHYQPHLPADLGFYDLRVPESRIAQAALARRYGIEGFTYWHYWFPGRRLLERPFNEVLHSGEPEFPFCLAWANESWTRRWWGDDREVLLRQEYSVADDVDHARWLARAFADPRYVRVGGRPLFLVYRPGDLPWPRRTTDIIRHEAVRAGLPDPLLLGIMSFSYADYREIGFDGMVAFEPAFGSLRGVNGSDLKCYDYVEARRAMRERLPTTPAYPCIMVGWDNTPRRGREAVVLTGSSPDTFEDGLRELVASVIERPPDDRLVFVNAWNEWAEGNHLEPDRVNGLRYLEAVDRVTRSATSEPDVPTAPERIAMHAIDAVGPVTAPASGSRRREPSPIIIFGAPRSGTTYIQRLLDRHPDVCISHETRVFAWLHAAVKVLPTSDQFVVTEHDNFVAHLRTTLPDVIRNFYEQLGPNVRYWGDKNPHYADPANRGCLALIAELFPGTRFVNIIRDGRDVVASLLRRRHANGEAWADFEAAHRTWIEHLEIGRTFGARQPDDSYFEICYEDFVRDDVESARALFGFLGIDFHPSVEAFCAQQRHQRTPLSAPTRTQIGDPSTSDWSTVLTVEEQARSLEQLGAYLVRLGYETEESMGRLRLASHQVEKAPM